MKYRLLRLLTALPLAGLLLWQPSALSTPITAQASLYAKMTQIQKRIVSGFGRQALIGGSNDDTEQDTERPSNYFPTGDDGCPQSKGGGDENGGNGDHGAGSNIKVNPDCLNLTDGDLQGRAQAQNETTIAQDPRDPNHLVAFYNNYQRGDGSCIGAYSLDGGKSWGYSIIPQSFTRGAANFGRARIYWQAGGDPSVAWDSRGNAYMTCQVFNRGGGVSPNQDQSSGVFVFRSTKNNGASWNFAGRPANEINNLVGNPAILEDKPYMAVDNNPDSPFRDRVYVAWTEFLANGTAYLWEVYSNDYGEHFSPRHLVSVTTPLCANNYGLPTPQGDCNENQFANPFVGPDGALYITYNNYNNVETRAGPDNRNQMLLVKSTDGGNTFGVPVKVGDYYDLPDCATYQGGQDLGRACVPEKGSSMRSVFRATNYPTGSVNPDKPNEVVVTFGSYINRHSNESNGCVPTGTSPATGNNLYAGVKTPGACNNDILVSVSDDGGATFTGTATDPRVMPVVTNQPGQATTDQWWQWQVFNKEGKLAVSYYDRQYGNDEFTGYSDVSLSGTKHIACAADVAHPDRTCFGTVRVTSSSNPPPTQFSGTFMGDYTGISAIGNVAYPLWTDTRNPDLFLCPGTGTPGVPPQVCTAQDPKGKPGEKLNDQDAFTAAVAIPNGPENDEGGGGDRSK